MTSRKPDDAAVFTCTDADLMPYVLPRDPKAKHEPTPDEVGPLHTMLLAYQELERLGWKLSIYAPRDGTTFLGIEAGSRGIFEYTRNENGDFWLYDGDIWPGKPILWKPL